MRADSIGEYQKSYVLPESVSAAGDGCSEN